MGRCHVAHWHHGVRSPLHEGGGPDRAVRRLQILVSEEMTAQIAQPPIPVPNGNNTLAVLKALREAAIAASNTSAGRANQFGTVPAANQSNQALPSPSSFNVANQVIQNLTLKTTNGDTVTIPTLVSLTLTNPVTGETWSWTAPSTITQQGVNTNNPVSAAKPGSGVVFDITAKFSGGGATLTASFVDVVVDFACTINKVTLLGSPAGSVATDITSVAVGSYSGAAGTSITASDKPTLSSAALYQDSTLTGWTTTIAAGTVLRFEITGTPTTTTDLTMSLECTRS